MRHKIGDTVRVRNPSLFQPQTEEMFAETIRALRVGEMPAWMHDHYVDVVLLNQEMVDSYNAVTPNDTKEAGE